jgi:TetR/AcrR family transcriptional repressor of uid operon
MTASQTAQVLAGAPDRAQRRGSPAADRIVAAAEICFAALGFEVASMEEIAQQAGMRAGNLYRYFPSKAALIQAVATRALDELGAEFQCVRSAENLWDALHATLERHLADEGRTRARLLVEIWAELSRSSSSVRSGDVSRAKRVLAAALAEARCSGRLDMDADTAASVIQSVARGAILRRASEPNFDAPHEIRIAMQVIGVALGSVADAKVEFPR